MNNKSDIKRNRPFESGEKNDPNLRDDTALQPGISTATSSSYKDDNSHLTETASDDFANSDFGKGADKVFDEKLPDQNE
jgi:hypothetical protein